MRKSCCDDSIIAWDDLVNPCDCPCHDDVEADVEVFWNATRHIYRRDTGRIEVFYPRGSLYPWGCWESIEQMKTDIELAQRLLQKLGIKPLDTNATMKVKGSSASCEG